MNIQGTFREHSGNIQGTFREHSGNIQGTFRERSGKLQGTFRKHSVNTGAERSGNIQGTDNVYLEVRLAAVEKRVGAQTLLQPRPPLPQQRLLKPVQCHL